MEWQPQSHTYNAAATADAAAAAAATADDMYGDVYGFCIAMSQAEAEEERREICKIPRLFFRHSRSRGLGVSEFYCLFSTQFPATSCSGENETSCRCTWS